MQKTSIQLKIKSFDISYDLLYKIADIVLYVFIQQSDSNKLFTKSVLCHMAISRCMVIPSISPKQFFCDSYNVAW